MEPDHVEPGLGDRATVLLQDLVHVLIVAPRHHQVRDATARLVDAILGAEDRMLQVGVALEGLEAEDALVGRRAADGEGVADDGPLLEHVLARDLRQGQDLADVVEQADQVEPIVVRPLRADALGGLEVVDAVRKVVVGVGVVHEVVQDLNHLHDRELALVELQPLLPCLLAELDGLLLVHRVVCPLHDLLALRVLVVAEGVTEGVLLRLPVVEGLERQALIAFGRRLLVGRLLVGIDRRALAQGVLLLHDRVHDALHNTHDAWHVGPSEFVDTRNCLKQL
mmetsp:Transcript_61385/g.165146  ORF Transcript_61385/g.165146 Transcript_61385/m.165146 type:complete len:281 (+) Transcript_61385:664-1506(+)